MQDTNTSVILKRQTYTNALSFLCRIALIAVSVFYMLNAVLPTDLSVFSGFFGAVVILSAMPLIKGSYRTPALVFLMLSLILMIQGRMTPLLVISGINSMLSLVSIMTVLQIFIVPIRAGGYDRALERYLKGRFSSETGIYFFISFITHLVGSFMLFGTVPMLSAFFMKPIKEMVGNPERFIVTAIGRSFTLVTLWAPGAVSMVLALESTGAEWLKVFPVAICLTVLGMVTSILLERATALKGRNISAPDTEESVHVSGDSKKILILIAIPFILLVGIMAMDLLHLISGSASVVIVGLTTAAVWMLFHRKGGRISTHTSEYWRKSLMVVPDLTVLFLSMGIFTAVIQASPFMDIIRGGIQSVTGILGPYSFLVVTPFIVLLSLTGIHPVIGLVFMGTLLSSAMADQATIIALSLLLGGAVSYSVSPFAGNIITLARFVGCPPAKAAFTWNGKFSLIFLAEGFLVLGAVAFFSG